MRTRLECEYCGQGQLFMAELLGRSFLVCQECTRVWFGDPGPDPDTDLDSLVESEGISTAPDWDAAAFWSRSMTDQDGS